jgi:hypothetical protein
MKKIHFKLGILFLFFLIQGCATNDSNSRLVRFWNDGFIYSEKEGKANSECSQNANLIYPKAGENDEKYYKIYRNCMKKKGY